MYRGGIFIDLILSINFDDLISSRKMVKIELKANVTKEISFGSRDRTYDQMGKILVIKNNILREKWLK